MTHLNDKAGHQPLVDFHLEYIQFINENSEWVSERPSFASDAWLIKAYESMVLCRVFDQKAVALQRTGQLGTFPSALGQEAFSIAVGLELQADDIFAPYYRDHGTYLLRGGDNAISHSLMYWGGDESGSSYGPVQDFPVCVPIATQITHAAGAAAALKIKGSEQLVMVTIGDGGTSKGDFFESLNVAGVWQLPLVILVNNNQYAISVSRDKQCGAQTLAQKAVGAGVHGIQVDGNDVLAVSQAIKEARVRANEHKGATLIEAITYRLSDHTTADDASRYRSAQEVKEAWLKEPVKRLQTLLINLKLWDSEKEKALQETSTALVEDQVKIYLNAPAASAQSMFDHLYQDWPEAMNEQLDMLAEKLERN